MKNIFLNPKQLLLIIALFTLAFTSSCKNDDEEEPVVWTNGPAISEVLNDLKQFEPHDNEYTLNASTGGTVTNEGIAAIFPADAFALENGTPYTGTVTIKMQTINSVSDMLFSGITATAAGELILSDGMLKINARDNSNNKLVLAAGKTFSLEFQNATLDPDQKLFIGEEVTNDENTVQWDSTDIKGRGGEIGGGVGIDNIGQLFEFCNLDRWMNETPLTDISVSTPTGYTNVNTECFMKYTGENSAAYIPSNFSLQKFSTIGGHYQVVQGRAAKILVIAKVGSSYFYQTENIAAIGANHQVTITSMVGTTLTGLKTIIENF